MDEKWYAKLVNKIKRSYHDVIVVVDHDRLGRLPELRAALADTFALHDYKGELPLRRFLKENAGQRILIFKHPEHGHLPYDVETRSDVITWQLKDIFPKLRPSALADLPGEQYQRVFEAYKQVENLLQHLGVEETRDLLTRWLAGPAVATSHDDLGLAIGVRPQSEEQDGIRHRCQALSLEIEELLARHPVDWRAVAPVWGELSYWCCQGGMESSEINALDRRISEMFTEYILGSYHELFYQGYLSRPATIDRILPFLSYQPASKKVLICMDGMGFQEWCCLKQYLAGRGIDSFNVTAVFALLPTVTRVSRRALFCGRPALGDCVGEERGFLQFVREKWPEGERRSAGVFMNIDGRWRQEYLDFDFLALSCNLVDDLAHAAVSVQESKELMQKNLMMHLEGSGFAEMVQRLLEEGYRVYLASDHGSVWCRGNGHHANRWLVEERARRALLFPNKLLAKDFAAEKNLLVYENSSLFGDAVAVFPPGREMFGTKGETAISHGGIHIEEMIVPFVEVQM
ncbi:MAG: PglZ domain-containing protein [Syntrophothermus sp.]|uniref:PglZ domain-containing protein n=1 Tax=Syntrophothermus sp. TaxID=2736299 RepID=UPI002579469F|nr:PglZ domain-containing protein [Syntrophothermus sp.]NSW83907.1 PglZ domain-containing protein [Syntrophothermus sp.]